MFVLFTVSPPLQRSLTPRRRPPRDCVRRLNRPSTRLPRRKYRLSLSYRVHHIVSSPYRHLLVLCCLSNSPNGCSLALFNIVSFLLFWFESILAACRVLCCVFVVNCVTELRLIMWLSCDNNTHNTLHLTSMVCSSESHNNRTGINIFRRTTRWATEVQASTRWPGPHVEWYKQHVDYIH